MAPSRWKQASRTTRIWCNCVSGGSEDASHLGDPCVGFVANAPDIRLNYTSGTLPLIFTVQAEADTTLLVNGPGGDWTCDDDSGPGRNPLVVFDNPQSGQYDIWVGTFGAPENHPAVLSISEIRELASNAIDLPPDPSLYPRFGSAYLTSGFRNDPHREYLTGGGPAQAGLLGTPCTGYVNTAPDFRLDFTAGKFPLYVSAESDGDATLVINGPDGRWYCDDDSGGDFDPLLVFTAPQSGQYDIWIGNFDSAAPLYGVELRISELGSGE